MTGHGLAIRPAAAADFARILQLNAESVHFLSPLAAAGLQRLHALAAYHCVAEVDGSVGAFLLALREGADYDSPNYRWFARRYPEFLYIDRVVVAAAHQGRGLGARLYEDLIAFGRAGGAPLLACEFDVEPPNPASAHFHARFGFGEVGSQWLGGGKKRVSLQVRPLR
jgi:predicted GNAT superfamily acetyltransferase